VLVTSTMFKLSILALATAGCTSSVRTRHLLPQLACMLMHGQLTQYMFQMVVIIHHACR
jgi:hypothetical protein